MSSRCPRRRSGGADTPWSRQRPAVSDDWRRAAAAPAAAAGHNARRQHRCRTMPAEPTQQYPLKRRGCRPQQCRRWPSCGARRYRRQGAQPVPLRRLRCLAMVAARSLQTYGQKRLLERCILPTIEAEDRLHARPASSPHSVATRPLLQRQWRCSGTGGSRWRGEPGDRTE